jgi:hypothetical protein
MLPHVDYSGLDPIFVGVNDGRELKKDYGIFIMRANGRESIAMQ